MWPDQQETADLVTFTEEILNEELDLCSEKIFIEEGSPFIKFSCPNILSFYKEL